MSRRIYIHLGTEEGARRKEALKAIAEQVGAIGQRGEPSVSVMMQQIADGQLEVKKMNGEVFSISGRHGTYIESVAGEFADSVGGEHNIPDMSLDGAIGYLEMRGAERGYSDEPVATDRPLQELVEYVGAD